MKVIIYKDKLVEFWLHINEIKCIHQHRYDHYTRLTVETIYQKCIEISDSSKQYSISDIHDFIKSENDIQIVKVQALHINLGGVSMYVKDWVQQAMG